MGRILAILLVTIILFGCGGEDKSSQPPATMPETGSPEGVALNENAALSISNSYLRVQMVPGLPPFASTLETDCEGQTCTIREPRTGIDDSVSLSDILNADTSTIRNLRQAAHFNQTRNGVAVYNGDVTFRLEDRTVDATAFGGWMVHSFFLAGWGNYSGPNFPSAEVGTGLSIGNPTGTYPAVETTYNGVMLGVITGEGRTQGNGVAGDATLEFSMVNPGSTLIDVAFTNITNKATGDTLSDMTWDDITVRTDGTFDAGNIHGLFYGPEHQEVGGTFNKADIVGAFGAGR